MLSIRGMSLSCRHLFILVASLSGMEVNYLNHNPCIPSCPGIFQFGTFVSVALSGVRCIFTFGPSLSPSTSFPILLIHLASLLCSLCFHILLQIVLFPCHPVVGMSSYFLPLLADRVCFFCCLNVQFCLFYPIWIFFFVYLLLLVSSGLFVSFVLLVELLFSFCHIFQHSSLVLCFFAYCRFLICIYSSNSCSGLEFLFMFLRGTPILSQINFAPA